MVLRPTYHPAMNMTPDRWNATSDYLTSVFGDPDDQLRTLMERAVDAGLPDIAVDASVGRLLTLLAKSVGAHTIVEVGTLAGYSAIWLARGLSPNGLLYTIEYEKKHADFARNEIETAGLADAVEVINAAGLDELPKLAEKLGPESVDVLFLDAVKTEYPAYLDAALPMLRPGALLIADNALGGGGWWIDEKPGTSDSLDAVNAFNQTIAADPRFDAACVPLREGVLIARYSAA